MFIHPQTETDSVLLNLLSLSMRDASISRPACFYKYRLTPLSVLILRQHLRMTSQSGWRVKARILKEGCTLFVSGLNLMVHGLSRDGGNAVS